jgi:CheY-like chemotaxis protein
MVFPFGTKNIEGPGKEVPGSYQISARVLWVDDEEAIINLGKMFLERLGHFADVAGSGKETLELLEKNRYDLLITDVGMPGMSGWQLAETIKGRYPGMKIAVVTGWGADVSNEEKAKHGVGYVLGKPITMMELKNLIGEILRSKV